MADTSFYLTSIHLLVSLAITIIVTSVSSAPVSLASSGDETANNIFSSASSLAKVIAEEAAELYKEFCNTSNLCGSSMERNLKMDLKLPEITDRCLSKDFNKEQCLHKIHEDLLRFQKYFTFLKKSLKSKKERVESIEHKTKTLSEAVKKVSFIYLKYQMRDLNTLIANIFMENNHHEEKVDNAAVTSMEGLKSKDAWNEKLTIYLILQSFKDYMIKTTRAIRNSRS
ncbi:PREDICTED: interleukin-6-like [Nanorana parkeri]|uniref:interleukin-6-like n=1 Tax=Nanorana parkeri TaxID=125878 RepID=UPI0008544E40|nr:PREDICTED: interleukin-6-like [Nanorana parkeri]